MKIASKAYGEIEIEEKQRISFPRGLFGFEELREFALLDSSQPPFYWLQSLERPDVAFVLIDPLFFRPDYEPALDPAEVAEIGITVGEDALVFAIVTVPASADRMTANLQGPLVINRRTRTGRQSISGDPRWVTKHVIIDELARAGQGASC